MTKLTDIYIVESALVRFIIFFIFQIFWIRLRKKGEEINSLAVIFLVTGIVSTLIERDVFQFSNHERQMSVISLILYFFIFVFYMLAVLGMAASALRLRLLILIFKNVSRGINYKDILKHYNRDKIVDVRLKRFVKTGEMGIENKKYFLRKPFSIFQLHGFIFRLMSKLYGI